MAYLESSAFSVSQQKLQRLDSLTKFPVESAERSIKTALCGFDFQKSEALFFVSSSRRCDPFRLSFKKLSNSSFETGLLNIWCCLFRKPLQPNTLEQFLQSKEKYASR